MKKSRLNFFKNTSMLISVLGVTMIVLTVIVAAYVGFNMISSGITTGISSGNQYDELASLQSDYSDLEGKFNSTKSSYATISSNSNTQSYDTFRLELSRANSDISGVQSALSAGKSSSEVDQRLQEAKQQLQTANDAYNKLSNN